MKKKYQQVSIEFFMSRMDVLASSGLNDLNNYDDDDYGRLTGGLVE